MDNISHSQKPLIGEYLSARTKALEESNKKKQNPSVHREIKVLEAREKQLGLCLPVCLSVCLCLCRSLSLSLCIQLVQ